MASFIPGGLKMKRSSASSALKKAKKDTQDAFRSFIKQIPRGRKSGSEPPPPLTVKKVDANGDARPKALQPLPEKERLAPKAEIEDTIATPTASPTPTPTLSEQWQKRKDPLLQALSTGKRMLFLQHKNDTKRVDWDASVSDEAGLRALFRRTFPDISMQLVSGQNVKVYIQDNSKPDVYYELERFEDLKDRSVLKLHDPKPAPLRPEEDYFSEPELEPSKKRNGLMAPPTTYAPSYQGRAYGTLGPEYRRPASALAPPKPNRYHQTGATTPTSPLRPPGAYAPPFESLDVYQPRPDSRTGSLPRSGSITPIIDEEARIRMDLMENQLSSLSNLVHSALMTHGKNPANDAIYRDIESIRKEIFGDEMASDSGSVSKFSDAANSISSEISPELRQSLRQARRRARELQTELRQLRRAAQINSQSTRTILKDAFERIKVVLQSNKHLQMFGQPPDMLARDPLQMERHLADHEQDRLRSSTQNLEKDMFSLEKEIEDLRHQVVNGHRRLRVTEVEKFTEKLTHIGKSAAVMKNQFPSFQQRLKNVMAAEMEKVVKEERFLKHEPDRIDGVLRRCKKIANTMVTMKKLALVQDPETPAGPAPIYESAHHASHDGLAQPLTTLPESKPTRTTSVDREPDRYSRPLATIGPPPQRKTSDTSILDSILEELKSVANGTGSGRGVKFGTNTVIDTNRTPEAPRRPNNLGVQNGNGSDIGHSAGAPPPPPQPPGMSPSDDQEVESLLDRIQKAQTGLKPTPSPPIRPESTPIYTRSIVRPFSETPSSKGWSGRAYGYNAHATRNTLSPTHHLPTIPQTGYIHESHSPLTARRSTTPSSITSEPPYMYSPSGGGRRPAPPPPPRSSSRGPTLTKYSDEDIQRMKEQLIQSDRFLKPTPFHQQNGGPRGAREHSHTPTPSVRTDATAEEIDYRFLKSASSSESINSQDGGRPRVPPPPPIRAMYR